MQALLLVIHILFAVIWVGGMAFAYLFLRPAAGAALEGPQRLELWVQTFRRFFMWVWAAVILLLLTGYAMIYLYWEGILGAPIYVNIMQVLGIVMILLFLHIFFAPYLKLKHAVAGHDFAEGAQQINRIRRVVATNLVLGLIVVAIAAGGRYIPFLS